MDQKEISIMLLKIVIFLQKMIKIKLTNSAIFDDIFPIRNESGKLALFSQIRSFSSFRSFRSMLAQMLELFQMSEFSTK
jgi:hypothetical protein